MDKMANITFILGYISWSIMLFLSINLSTRDAKEGEIFIAMVVMMIHDSEIMLTRSICAIDDDASKSTFYKLSIKTKAVCEFHKTIFCKNYTHLSKPAS